MEFLSYLISGISLGSIYAIIALGYTMVYGIAKMLNFAHGDIIMIGGYVSFCSMYYLNLPPIVATLLAVIACTVLGIVIERLAYAPLRSAPSLAVLITAIGVSYFLQNSALLIWKAAAKTYPPVVAGAVQLFNGQLTISYISLLTIAACIVIMLALTTFVSKSKMGKAMRACSEDKGAAQLMGINVNSTISATFAIGSALAAIAGVLLCSFNTSLMPTTGSMPGIKAFTAAVFGGIGSIPGAFLGGLLLGIIEALAKAYISTQLANSIVFAVLIVVLLVKPAGLLGKIVPRKCKVSRMKQRKISKTNVVNFSTYLGMVIFFLVMTALSKAGVLNRSMTGLLVPICCYMSMAVSLNLTVGILGELSLGHAGFMSVGAFAGVIASQSLLDVVPSAGLRLTIAMIVGALFATVAGFIVGAPVLRLQGDYLAIVTLAFGEIIKELVTCLIVGHDENGLHILFNLTGNKTVEDLGLSDTGIAIIKGAQGTASVKTIASFTAGFILVMVTLFIVLNLKHSRPGGPSWRCGTTGIATSSIGINTTKYKLMAFVTSAALAGAAGALYGLNYSSLQAAKFNFNTSILVLVFVVLGGLGNIWGSLVAAAALTILPEALREFADYRMLVYAIVLILVMLATHNPTLQSFFARLKPGKKEEKEAA